MEAEKLFELEERELGTLTDFLESLKAERDAIISFSLEGIIRENNRKEEILKRLEFLESEKEKLLSAIEGREALVETESARAVRSSINRKMREVRTALEKNMGLLSFSMDHVKTSMEKVMDFVNRGAYKREKSISVMISRKV
jgi:hypothetical protein